MRVLLATYSCYLDDSNGAAVACRALMEMLARRGFAVEVLCGSMLDIHHDVDFGDWLASRGYAYRESGETTWSVDPSGMRPDRPRRFDLNVRGVPITVHRGATTRPHAPGSADFREYLHLLEAAFDRFRPDVVMNYGGDLLAHEVRSRARARGASVVFPLHNFQYTTVDPFLTADAVVVPSRYAAEHYRETLGIDCAVLPNPIDFDRIRAPIREPGYVTFVTPTPEKGVSIFARIADELGRVRPDIPFLVVEGRGTERTLADCGIDLRAHGNVSLIENTPDPRRFWSVTRVCLMPSLWKESQGLAAVEAMIQGIPVVASDRGALPETLGSAGIALGLPSRLTPITRELPTPEEVAPWVRALIRLWDDADWYDEHSRLALAESIRWSPETLEPPYVRFFEGLRRLR